MKSAFIKGTVDVLKSVAVSFYTADDLAAAKTKLHKTAEHVDVDGLPRLKSVLVHTEEKQKLMILSQLCSCLTRKKMLHKLPKYVAVDTSRLPTIPVENIDMVFLVNKVNQLEKRLTSKYKELDARLVLLELSHSTTVRFEELESRLALLEKSRPTTIPGTR